MGLAWEMLEMARMVYEQQAPGSHMDELAEIHLALGGIMSEQVRARGGGGGLAGWLAGWA
jgi:hypothetical protein